MPSSTKSDYVHLGEHWDFRYQQLTKLPKNLDVDNSLYFTILKIESSIKLRKNKCILLVVCVNDKIQILSVYCLDNEK